MIGTEWGTAAVGAAPQSIDNNDVIAGVLLVDGEPCGRCRIKAFADDRRVVDWLLRARDIVTLEHPSLTLTAAMLAALGAPC